jgi:hypothetical protein
MRSGSAWAPGALAVNRAIVSQRATLEKVFRLVLPIAVPLCAICK